MAGVRGAVDAAGHRRDAHRPRLRAAVQRRARSTRSRSTTARPSSAPRPPRFEIAYPDRGDPWLVDLARPTNSPAGDRREPARARLPGRGRRPPRPRPARPGADRAPGLDAGRRARRRHRHGAASATRCGRCSAPATRSCCGRRRRRASATSTSASPASPRSAPRGSRSHAERRFRVACVQVERPDPLVYAPLAPNTYANVKADVRDLRRARGGGRQLRRSSPTPIPRRGGEPGAALAAGRRLMIAVSDRFLAALRETHTISRRRRALPPERPDRPDRRAGDRRHHARRRRRPRRAGRARSSSPSRSPTPSTPGARARAALRRPGGHRARHPLRRRRRSSASSSAASASTS